MARGLSDGVSDSVQQRCTTLRWGDEEWTRADDLEGEEALLYLEDYQLTNPAILETGNSLLSSGEVPGMYTHEELVQSALDMLMAHCSVRQSLLRDIA